MAKGSVLVDLSAKVRDGMAVSSLLSLLGDLKHKLHPAPGFNMVT
jgi:hypothetical protein